MRPDLKAFGGKGRGGAIGLRLRGGGDDAGGRVEDQVTARVLRQHGVHICNIFWQDGPGKIDVRHDGGVDKEFDGLLIERQGCRGWAVCAGMAAAVKQMLNRMAISRFVELSLDAIAVSPG